MDMQDWRSFAIEDEEWISADEYLRRFAAGQIDPAKVRPALRPPKGRIGGFIVKLDQPRFISPAKATRREEPYG